MFMTFLCHKYFNILNSYFYYYYYYIYFVVFKTLHKHNF